LETPEAAADDDYPMWFLCCGHDCQSATHPTARPFIIIPAFVTGVGSKRGVPLESASIGK
jgi:hypothetical protein